jgi:hypothetical protein
MRYLKTYTHYNESVVNYLPDILLEINDEFLWKADCWSVINSQEEKWFLFVERSCAEYNEEEESEEEEVLRPTQSVIDAIMRSIDFMSGEGFINYKITLESFWSLLKKIVDRTHIFSEPARYTTVGSGELINLEDISDLEFYADTFLRIEFWK